MTILVVARRGSGKNLWFIEGKSLLRRACDVARQASLVLDEQVVLSTNYIERELSIDIRRDLIYHKREQRYSEPDTNIIDVINNLNDEGYLSDVTTLVQPTSVFTRVEDIIACTTIMRLMFGGSTKSCMTATKVRHNHHWLNQRIVKGNQIGFAHIKDRAGKNNKQDKQTMWQFGNCVSFDTDEAIKQGTCFPHRTCYIPIPWHLAWDVDTKEDLRYAELLSRY